MFFKKVALASALAITASAGSAFTCEIDARVSIIGNEFPAIQTVGAGAIACPGLSRSC